ncbi:hypothetical protein QA641_17945 [Bradyrhizobium sp. CB1650]|uniref:hypothetical protein n=1 Tax=Bradyrhizobium sp. CB1650 TaxID=3039153 RepID=UPI0024347FFF|nr:hypothetical protein [Bradyrhizobium sp. CB1650]WGD55590.1 hypothetical protein QA641_17945 [Bradyrhizobium sp. CB1650]
MRLQKRALFELAARELIVGLGGSVARMLDDDEQFRLSSVRALLQVIAQRAAAGAGRMGPSG